MLGDSGPAIISYLVSEQRSRWMQTRLPSFCNPCGSGRPASGPASPFGSSSSPPTSLPLAGSPVAGHLVRSRVAAAHAICSGKRMPPFVRLFVCGHSDDLQTVSGRGRSEICPRRTMCNRAQFESAAALSLFSLSPLSVWTIAAELARHRPSVAIAALASSFEALIEHFVASWRVWPGELELRYRRSSQS